MSKHQISGTVLWLLRRGGVTTHDFLGVTAENLVAHATIWSLTLSPVQYFLLNQYHGTIILNGCYCYSEDT